MTDHGLIIGQYGKGGMKPTRNGSNAKATRCPTPGELVRYNGESHLMTFGVTGSGKTAGPVICNALDHDGPLISLECKGDVYAKTVRRRREMGQEIALLDLRGPNPDSSQFNPFDAYMKSGDDLGLLARSVAADALEQDTLEEKFWTYWAETMITAGITHIFTHSEPEQRNFSALFDLFNDDDLAYNLAKMLDMLGPRMHRSARTGFTGFLQLSEKETRPSVLGCTQQHLRLWDADFIRHITARTSFDLAGLIAGKPITLYIIVPPMRMKAYAPLLRIWLSSLLTALMSRGQRPQPKRTLILCDELGALGKIDSFVTASTLLRSASVQLWSFWQNPAQLAVYGNEARTLIDNAGVLQFLGAKNLRMAREFADLVGGITPEEIMALAPDEQIVLIDGGLPQTLKRVRYFEHPALRDLAGRSEHPERDS